MDLQNSSTDIKTSKSNDSNHPILYRTLSTIPANQILANKERKILAKNYRRTSINDQIVTIDHPDADASFILPNLSELSEEIRSEIINNLIDFSTMNVLQKTKHLNWWVDQKFSCSILYPLITNGDGNCLLHATSLAMWGFHDHALSMRKALNETLVTLKTNNSFFRRWRWQQSIQNKKYNLIYSENEWKDEWECLLSLSSIKPRIKLSESNKITPDGLNCQSIQQCYESLEEFHVYVLANNIRRPIIIYSETILRTKKGEAISSIEFGGIYLPLEIPPENCYKQPIFLAFNAAHFSALVPMESNNKTEVIYRIPLIDLETFELLPIHFLIDPGVNFQWPINEELSDEKIHLYSNTEQNRIDILEKYLNLSKEYSSLNNFLSSSIEDENQISTIDDSTNHITDHKKSSHLSLNKFSKTIRRKFFHSFSSTKQTNLKHHQLSINNENSSQQQQQQQQYSPLLNRETNILKIIFTNFQPKRPKISDHMIKNYIDTCIDEYQTKQNDSDHEKLSTNIQSSIYCRHHRPNQTYPLTDNIPKNNDNEQFSKNINFVQTKFDELTSNNNPYHDHQSSLNEISNSTFILSSCTNRKQSSNSDNDSNNE